MKIPKALQARLGKTSTEVVSRIGELVELHAFLERQSAQSIRANPFLGMRPLDAERVVTPFSRSTVEGLRNWTGTERELVNEAMRLSGRTIDDLAVRGLLREAAVIIQDDYTARNALASGGRQRIAGGARSDDLYRAAEAMRDDGTPITPSTLRTATGVAFRSCQRFLDRLGPTLGLFLQADGKTWLATPPPRADLEEA